MARSFEDDLRRKFLAAHDRGRQAVREIADNFGVSYGWGRKVIDQRKRNGQAERVRPRPVPHPLRLTVALALIDHLAPPSVADAEVVCDFAHRLPPTIMGRQKFPPQVVLEGSRHLLSASQ